jgi:hypothetical protein
MENQHLVSPSPQCSSTPVGFGQGFLGKEQCDKTGAFPIFSWPGPDDFLPFLRLKSAPKGGQFCDATDIVKNATEELKRL